MERESLSDLGSVLQRCATDRFPVSSAFSLVFSVELVHPPVEEEGVEAEALHMLGKAFYNRAALPAQLMAPIRLHFHSVEYCSQLPLPRLCLVRFSVWMI